jgi:membrane protein
VTTLVNKFFRDRGTHLAAMIAYFALLSFIPLVFLALALLGLAGRADEESQLVTELGRLFPSESVSTIVSVVRAIQRNAATLGIIGALLLVWTSLSLFSVLESAFNIVYGRPNRSFLRGKALAVLMLVGSLVVLFVGLVAGSIGSELLQTYAPGFTDNEVAAYALSVVISAAASFVFRTAVYYFLTNVKHTLRDVVPGAITATFFLAATFQVLPVYARVTSDLVTLRAFSGLPILLIWLYLMANMIVFGAEVNWWFARRRGREEPDEVPGLA